MGSFLSQHTGILILILMLLTREPIFFNEAIEAATNGKPVLIPCFGVGRSQELLYMFKNRIHTLPEEDQSQLNIVYDGMAQRATNTYNEHCRGEFAAESIRNYIVNSGDQQPFLFDQASSARRMPLSREELLEADRNTHYNRTLWDVVWRLFSHVLTLEFTQRYDEVRIILCGYQAEGTPGRRLEDQYFFTKPLS